MLPARPSRDDQPRRPGGEFLSTKALLLLIIAGGIAVLYEHSPRLGAAVVAAITVLAVLNTTINDLAARAFRAWPLVWSPPSGPLEGLTRTIGDVPVPVPVTSARRSAYLARC
jgi:hypothetical protein